MNKEQMVNYLDSGICQIVFTKVDGTERIMHGTRATAFIPEDKRATSDTQNTDTDNIIRVFDVQIGEWRCFRVDSVKKFTV